jgi:hypothetical protein
LVEWNGKNGCNGIERKYFGQEGIDEMEHEDAGKASCNL